MGSDTILISMTLLIVIVMTLLVESRFQSEIIHVKKTLNIIAERLDIQLISADEIKELREPALNGNKIAAIKKYRKLTDEGLAESKEYIENLMVDKHKKR